MIDESISMRSEKVGEYSVEISTGWNDEFLITRNSDGAIVLFVALSSNIMTRRHFSMKTLYGMDVFDIIAVETGTMRKVLARMLDAVKEKENGFIAIDSIDYDGTGVELAMQFGYMTGGVKMNLSAMSVDVSPALVFADSDCNVTLCCVMGYCRDGKNDERLVRLGSGKGVDEAVSNAKRRIESLIEGLDDIDEYLFRRLCIGCTEKESVASHILEEKSINGVQCK